MSAVRRVLVTGANKGIGKATVAAILTQHDDTEVLLGSRNKDRGDAARASLVAENAAWADRIAVVAIDVSDDASVKAAAQWVADTYGDDAPLYGVVNNAGIGLGASDMATVLNVNTHGPKRVVDAFKPLLQGDGRVVMVSSASGPNFVAACSPGRQTALIDPEVVWATVEAVMQENLALVDSDGDFGSAGFGPSANAYGLSKACLNAYTIELARENPAMTINACTPGFIETDLTRPYAESRGVSPKQMGMKTPLEGTVASMHLLFGDVGGSGWYFGSDAKRSPLDRYRSPGDPEYTGD